MFYVYMNTVRNGRFELLRIFDDEADAIKHIALCYRKDTELGQLGEYYYTYEKR